MDTNTAENTIRSLIPSHRWDAFTDWMEELAEEYSCEHDGESYIEWFEQEGSASPLADSEAMYAAMEVFANTGPCACAAGQDILSYPSS